VGPAAKRENVRLEILGSTGHRYQGNPSAVRAMLESGRDSVAILKNAPAVPRNNRDEDDGACVVAISVGQQQRRSNRPR